VIAGLDYGSEVPGQVDLSYTEYDYNRAAARPGLPCLALMVSNPKVELSRVRKQFRSRLLGERIVATVNSPEELHVQLIHALRELN